MSEQPGQERGSLNSVRKVVEIAVVAYVIMGGTANVANLPGASAFRSVAQSGMNFVLGDPCDGVEHPGFQSDDRIAIVDGVQEHLEADTNVRWFVDKVSFKDGWAYIETGPPPGGEYRAYILRRVGQSWKVDWEGEVGAQAGDPDYPANFESSDQDILRCKCEPDV